LAMNTSMPEAISKLDQRALFRGRRCFAILKDGRVTATYAGPSLRQEVTMQLVGINPNATRQRHVATDMIVGMAIFAIPLLGFLWGAVTARFGSEAFFWFVGGTILFMLPVGLCWREYVRRSYDLLVFSEPLTGNQLVMFRSVPDQAAVDGFVATLQTEMQKARESAELSSGPGSVMLSAELERLAALRDRGVLSEAEFQQAKTTLLAGGENRRIGFQV
jgi:hypothetical protein